MHLQEENGCKNTTISPSAHTGGNWRLCSNTNSQNRDKNGPKITTNNKERQLNKQKGQLYFYGKYGQKSGFLWNKTQWG